MGVDPDLYHRIAAQLFADASGVFAATDTSAGIVTCNPAFAEACGLPSDDLHGVSLIDAMGQAANSQLARAFADLEQRHEQHATVLTPDRRGIETHRRWAFTLRYYEHLDLVLLWGRDLTEEGRLNQEIRDRTTRDRLTGLVNRGALTREIEEVLKAGQAAALLILDIDGFTLVNDTYGHDFGDLVLTVVGRRLVQAAGLRNTAARIGGDQFALLLRRLSDVDSVLAKADQIQQSISGQIAIEGTPVYLGVSMGVAVAGEQSTALELFREADIALSQAKHQGGDRVQRFRHEFHEQLQYRVKTELALRSAVRAGELDADVQGIYSLPERTLVGFEALVRWRHPTRGTVMPNDFIEIAESCGLLGDLFSAVLDRTLGSLAGWLAADPTRSVSVNVAPSQLTQPDLVGRITDALDLHRVAPAQLTIEVTEDQLVGDKAQIRTLNSIDELGVKLAIDDFGSGASSLGYFWALPMSKLKLDRGFITSMSDDDRVLTIVGSVISLAHRLGMSVVAEGIETEEQLATLIQLGCAQAQGYLLHRPCSLDEALENATVTATSPSGPGATGSQ